MKKNLILGAALAAIVLAGCNKDENNPPPDGRTALTVTSGIQTRAHDNVWDTGDAIGIYMLDGATAEAANKRYTTASGGTNGTFAPADPDQTIYFPVSGDTRDFVAYYPYTTIGADNLYAVNVTNQSSQQAIDLMAATKVTDKSKNDPAVTFVFAHKLVKIDITLQGDGVSITNDQLLNTIVKITNQQTAGTYNVVDGGNVTVTGGSAADITLFTNDLKAEGIVLPNTTTEGMKLTFAVPALNNQTYAWEIKKAEKSQLFEAGKKYKYTITIAEAGLSVSSTVTDWEAGNGESGDAEIPMIGSKTDPATADVGDFYFSDGSLEASTADLTPEQENACIGIVFWKDPNNSSKGKIVSLNEGGATWSTEWEETGAGDLTNGRANMEKIAKFINSNIRLWDDFPAFLWVAEHLNSHSDGGWSSTDGWYLPAIGELMALYGQYNFAPGNYGSAENSGVKEKVNESLGKISATSLSDNIYWSSSEYGSNPAYDAWGVYFRYGLVDWYYKRGGGRVRGVFAF